MRSRKVIDGEVITGHGNKTTGFPSIEVLGQSHSSGIPGALMFSIEAFNWAKVSINEDQTTLTFENKVTVRTDGDVYYYDVLSKEES